MVLSCSAKSLGSIVSFLFSCLGFLLGMCSWNEAHESLTSFQRLFPVALQKLLVGFLFTSSSVSVLPQLCFSHLTVMHAGSSLCFSKPPVLGAAEFLFSGDINYVFFYISSSLSSLHLFDLLLSLSLSAHVLYAYVCVHMQRPEEVVWCPVYHFLSGFFFESGARLWPENLINLLVCPEHPSPPHQLWSYRCPVAHDHARLCGDLSLGLHAYTTVVSPSEPSLCPCFSLLPLC